MEKPRSVFFGMVMTANKYKLWPARHVTGCLVRGFATVVDTPRKSLYWQKVQSHRF
jgi:hypothetical protein